MDSTMLGIVTVSKLSDTIEDFPVQRVFGKYIRLPNSIDSSFVLIPLLHEPEKVNFI